MCHTYLIVKSQNHSLTLSPEAKSRKASPKTEQYPILHEALGGVLFPDIDTQETFNSYFISFQHNLQHSQSFFTELPHLNLPKCLSVGFPPVPRELSYNLSTKAVERVKHDSQLYIMPIQDLELIFAGTT